MRNYKNNLDIMEGQIHLRIIDITTQKDVAHCRTFSVMKAYFKPLNSHKSVHVFINKHIFSKKYNKEFLVKVLDIKWQKQQSVVFLEKL